MQRLQAKQLDRKDRLRHIRKQFIIPGEAYLCGHSLGAMLKDAPKKMAQLMKCEYGKLGVQAWNEASWIYLPKQLGDDIAPLIGAKPEEVLVTDSTSINLFKLIFSAVTLQTGRTTIVIDKDIFPTDLYIAQSVTFALRGHEIVRCSYQNMNDNITQNTALVIISHVNYRNGELNNLKKLTQIAHQHGALILCDLSHSVGLMPIELNRIGVDFAVGCTYKYLNGGPGSPAFLFVSEKHLKTTTNPLMGWMGHESPFDFSDQYFPAKNIKKFLCGTPAILSLGALATSIKMINQCSLGDIQAKYQELGNYCIYLMKQYCPEIKLITPTDAEKRGAHIGFIHKKASAISQELIAKGIIVDYRPPNLIRLGLSPLYTRFIDVLNAVENIVSATKRVMYADFS